MTSGESDVQAPSGVLVTALWAVAIAAVGLSLIALWLFGVRGLVGALCGGAMAVVNLWAVSRIVRGLLGDRRTRTRYSLLAVIKITLLLGVVYLLLTSGVIPILALAIGYGALPIGIVVGQLWAVPEDEHAQSDKG